MARRFDIIETGLQRFLNANRSQPRIKFGAGFA